MLTETGPLSPSRCSSGRRGNEHLNIGGLKWLTPTSPLALLLSGTSVELIGMAEEICIISTVVILTLFTLEIQLIWSQGWRPYRAKLLACRRSALEWWQLLTWELYLPSASPRGAVPTSTPQT